MYILKVTLLQAQLPASRSFRRREKDLMLPTSQAVWHLLSKITGFGIKPHDPGHVSCALPLAASISKTPSDGLEGLVRYLFTQ